MTTTGTAVDEQGGIGPDTGLDVVTGAFGFTGNRIAALLAGDGRRVRTLTGHPQRAPEGTAIEVRPLDFDDPLALTRSLEGATTLYNTYWVRFARGRRDHVSAAANSRTLFTAAQRAGVQRIVHVSITHPSIECPDPYFRGKALAEQALAECGVSYGVARPGILFGDDGVLINNIAWLLRHLPVFGVGGDGSYRVRPIHVDDLARLCVSLGNERADSIVNAVGPDRPTFLELVPRHPRGRRQPGCDRPRARRRDPRAVTPARIPRARRRVDRRRVPVDGGRPRGRRRSAHGDGLRNRVDQGAGQRARYEVCERAGAALSVSTAIDGGEVEADKPPDRNAAFTFRGRDSPISVTTTTAAQQSFDLLSGLRPIQSNCRNRRGSEASSN